LKHAALPAHFERKPRAEPLLQYVPRHLTSAVVISIDGSAAVNPDLLYPPRSSAVGWSMNAEAIGN